MRRSCLVCFPFNLHVKPCARFATKATVAQGARFVKSNHVTMKPKPQPLIQTQPHKNGNRKRRWGWFLHTAFYYPWIAGHLTQVTTPWPKVYMQVMATDASLEHNDPSNGFDNKHKQHLDDNLSNLSPQTLDIIPHKTTLHTKEYKFA